MKKKIAPALPRFRCPKDMKTRVFKSKKDKMQSRAELNKATRKIQDEDI